MGLPSRIPTAVAWIVVALMVAWAPLFHAICIAPAESSAATHVMADGTVMTTAALSGDSAPADHSAGGEPTGIAALAGPVQDALTTAGPSTPLIDATGVVGLIVVVTGLAALAMAVFVRRCRMLPSRGDPPRRRPARPTWGAAPAWLWTDVDLHRLGISRT
ncbi:hypothetical protein [Agromyces bauzanensis]